MLSTKRVYKIFKEQVIVIKEYIEEILNKSYIRLSISLYTTSILTIKKLDDNLRIYVDHRTLNALIIRN